MNRRLLPVLLALMGGIVMHARADTAEDRFKHLPFGCAVTRAEAIPADQMAAVGRKLGASLTRLSNTTLNMQGATVQVNILETSSDDDARKLHETIAKMRKNPAFCLLRGRTVVEFVKTDAATATKAAWELGFVQKPQCVTYRVAARVATIRKADYTAANELFNLFCTIDAKSPDAQTADRMAALLQGFSFGDSLTLRTRSGAASAWRFTPEPVAAQTLAGDCVAYTFRELPRTREVPFVTISGEIACDSTGMTPSDRNAGAELLSATAYWPVGDPEIAALARRITAGRLTADAKVRALLEWLAPGTNIKSDGPAGSRWGVKKVLEQKFGHCWDSSDCFVTLARAAGVPARQVAGWLYGSSGHVWAEVLIEGKGWQQVDPTGAGRLDCGIYHVAYFTTETGEMPVLYLSRPQIEVMAVE